MNKPLLAAACLLLVSQLAVAQPRLRGPDYSGTYDCTGDDAQEGPYTGTVTLRRVPEHSVGFHAAYTFQLDVPGYGAYPGHAVAKGSTMAIHFANVDPATRDYGTGLASFRKTRTGKWVFDKFYYEPEFKGGNHGVERCRQR